MQKQVFLTSYPMKPSHSLAYRSCVHSQSLLSIIQFLCSYASEASPFHNGCIAPAAATLQPPLPPQLWWRPPPLPHVTLVVVVLLLEHWVFEKWVHDVILVSLLFSVLIRCAAAILHSP